MEEDRKERMRSLSALYIILNVRKKRRENGEEG